MDKPRELTGSALQPEHVNAVEEPVDVNPGGAQETQSLASIIHQMVEDQLHEMHDEADEEVRRHEDT